MRNIIDTIRNTPLVEVTSFQKKLDVKIFAKLEGNNPAGSVKDRAALNMIRSAIEKGRLKRGDKLIEATSGNTGIALAMIANMFEDNYKSHIKSTGPEIWKDTNGKITHFVSAMGTTIPGIPRWSLRRNGVVSFIIISSLALTPSSI